MIYLQCVLCKTLSTIDKTEAELTVDEKVHCDRGMRRLTESQYENMIERENYLKSQ